VSGLGTRAAERASDRAATWRFSRAVERVRAVDRIVADYATTYCGRPVRRYDVAPLESAVHVPGVTWTIEGEVVIEFVSEDAGPGRLNVYEFALLRPVKQAIRSRHIVINYVASVGGSRR
jgi:hypothetical protein